MKYTIFGESHGPAIGVALEGIPAGMKLDMSAIKRELARRAPGQSALATERKEPDKVTFLSGVFHGETTGDPICAMIENTDQHSGDYAEIRDLARPGHADYTGYLASHGSNDYRGGGHFSGRLTAPLVVAGTLARQVLDKKHVQIAARIRSISDIEDIEVDYAAPNKKALMEIAQKEFPVMDDGCGQRMQGRILEAKLRQDSLGGVIECFLMGVPAGLGRPDFGKNVEGIFSQYLYAVPAVKAVAFGEGFRFAAMRGSEANDPFYMSGNRICTKTNHNGGVNGGITNGMPVVFSVAIKPTPSIGVTQDTVNFRKKTDAKIEVKGRHDPCIVQRAVPVIEAAAALALCDLMGY